jgi:PKHD-type hydroxylase
MARVTAGCPVGRSPNRDEQLPQDCEAARTGQQIVMAALNRHDVFFSAALPKRVFPPLFNRYAGSANAFGNHVDNAVRFVPGGQAERVRTDISCTLFLVGARRVRRRRAGRRGHLRRAAHQAARRRHGAVSRHQRAPCRAGHARRAALPSFFWVESMVRSDEQRRLLYDMDMHLMRLRGSIGEADPAVVGPDRHVPQPAALWADV